MNSFAKLIPFIRVYNQRVTAHCFSIGGFFFCINDSLSAGKNKFPRKKFLNKKKKKFFFLKENSWKKNIKRIRCVHFFKNKMTDLLTCTTSSDEERSETSSEVQYIPSPILSPARPTLVVFEDNTMKNCKAPKAPRPSRFSPPCSMEELGNCDWLLDVPNPLNPLSPMSPQTAYIDKLLTFNEEEFDAFVADFDPDADPPNDYAYHELIKKAAADVLVYNKRKYGCVGIDNICFDNITQPDLPIDLCSPPLSPIRDDMYTPSTPKNGDLETETPESFLSEEDERVLQKMVLNITRDGVGKILDTEDNRDCLKQLFVKISNLVTHHRHLLYRQEDDSDLRQKCTDVTNRVIKKKFNICLETQLNVDGFERYKVKEEPYIRPLIRTIASYDEGGQNLYARKKMRLLNRKGFYHIGNCMVFLHNQHK